MSVKYNVIECKNLLAKLAAPKFYASAKADGEISLKTIKIAENSTIHFRHGCIGCAERPYKSVYPTSIRE